MTEVNEGCEIMNEIDKSRRIEFTILKVDSIPCSLNWQKAIFTYDGNKVSDPWVLKWPMPWVDRELKKITQKYDFVSKKEKRRIYNPDEPDQWIQVLIRSYIDLTVPELIDSTAKRYPEKEALVNSTGSRRLKYKDFVKSANALAKGLIYIGVEKDEKVAVWAVNSPEVAICEFGVSKAAGIFVPMNAYEKQINMEKLLEQSDIHTLIMQTGTKGTENIELLYKICPELCESGPGMLNSKKFPKLKNVIIISGEEYPGTYMWSEVLAQGEKSSDEILAQRQGQINIDDVAQIIHTSGSTGTPKGVMLSHSNIIENAKAMSDLMELSEKDIMCVQAPIFHCFGSIACVMAAVVGGCSMVMVNRFKTKITLSLIEKERCTVLSSVPALFISCLKDIQNEYYDISSLRTGIIAGASCLPEVIEDIKNMLGMEDLILSYGLTEASPCVTATKCYSEFEENTVGKPIPGVKVKTIDLNTKEDLPQGQNGEILVRGYNVMNGYYKMQDETDNAIDREGWFHTGDIGCLTEEGYLMIRGRCKDIIIRCGENISSNEIEGFLSTHKDVEEVHVVGIPEASSGEEIVAFIKPKGNIKLTEKQIRDYCRGKIATNKVPRYIKFVEEFQLSDTGKVLKKDLKKKALSIFGHNAAKVQVLENNL